MSKNRIIAFFLAGGWIGFSEFLRNDILFRFYWLEKYASLGLDFPTGMLNNLFWALWSFLLAFSICFLLKKLTFWETVFITWIMAFFMMWVVIFNLNVLPLGLLFFAVPLSILEVYFAVFIYKKVGK